MITYFTKLKIQILIPFQFENCTEINSFTNERGGGDQGGKHVGLRLSLDSKTKCVGVL